MKIAKSTFIAPGAVVLGDVEMKEDVSIWYHATVRGDKEPCPHEPLHATRYSHLLSSPHHPIPLHPAL